MVRALQLGDMLCCVPALRALRAAFPAARISLVGLPWAREFVARFRDYLDDFVEFPGYPGLPEREYDARAVAHFLDRSQERAYDLALQFHGDGRLLNPLTQLLGARMSAGFYVPGQYCPDPERYRPWQATAHEVLRYVRLLHELGVPDQGLQLEFPLHEEDLTQYDALRRRHGLQGSDYVCIHPGSQLPSRRWHPERFAAVADALSRQGYRVVLTGTAGESALTRNVAGAMRARPVDLAGQTSLGGAAALIANAAAIVCNDTGVSHVAAAMGTPSVVVCCGADPVRWAPLDRDRHRVLFAPMDCRPCAHRSCPIGHVCASAITVEAVLEAAAALLGEGVRRGSVRGGQCPAYETAQ